MIISTKFIRAYVCIVLVLFYIPQLSFSQYELKPFASGAIGGAAYAPSFSIYSNSSQGPSGIAVSDSGAIISSGFINVLIDASSSVNERNIYVENLSIETSEDTPKNITLKGSDGLWFEIKEKPNHGVITGTFPDIKYIPDSNFNGLDFFTYQGSKNGVNTKTAVCNISVLSVNDPPELPIEKIYITSIEDSEINISHEMLLELTQADDIDGDSIIFKITDIIQGNLKTSDYRDVSLNETEITDSENNLIWKPSDNKNGQIHGFNLVAYDGELISETCFVYFNVGPIPDFPISIERLPDLEVDENTGPFDIDLSKYFYDADFDDFNFFIEKVENSDIVRCDIQNTLLTMSLMKNINGRSFIKVGFESGNDIIYDEFELVVKSVLDKEPYLVADYWRGISDDYGNINLDQPTHYWSFETLEDIDKTSKMNWRFETESEPINEVLDIPNVNYFFKKWRDAYFINGESIRVQNNNFLEFFINNPLNEINQISSYTIVIDIRTKYGRSNPFFNTSHGDFINRAEGWINQIGSVGGQRRYSKIGSLKPNLWCRLIYSINAEAGTRNVFIDFEKVLSQAIDEDLVNRHMIKNNRFRLC